MENELTDLLNIWPSSYVFSFLVGAGMGWVIGFARGKNNDNL
jgi:hypothetical protein